MKVRKGILSICCINMKGKVPSAKRLARIDRRIIYLGAVQTPDGKELKDAFVFTLAPQYVYTIKDARIKNDVVFISVVYNCLSDWVGRLEFQSRCDFDDFIL